MYGKGSGIRRALWAPLTALMLLLSVAIPMLDIADFGSEAVVESQHDPASCAPAHDHTLCTQVGANQALLPQVAARTPTATVTSGSLLGSGTSVRVSALAEGHPARGPPSI